MQNESTNETLDREFSGSVHASLKIIDPLKINALASLVETNTRNGYYQTQYYPIDFGLMAGLPARILYQAASSLK